MVFLKKIDLFLVDRVKIQIFQYFSRLIASRKPELDVFFALVLVVPITALIKRHLMNEAKQRRHLVVKSP